MDYIFNSDEKKARLVVVLLREYGIKHIVVASGSKHTYLARFVEHNSCFQLHKVVDERSAGFYAIGISAKINEPVAVFCTSGTAASNFLSSVSEAFYQKLPIIYVTMDKNPYLLNQREDQMVPQIGMYGEVCKKCVALPIGNDDKSIAICRRMVADAILEATHGDNGPVQINIPLVNAIKRELPEEGLDIAYNISDVKIKKIRRYLYEPDKSGWEEPVKRLKNSAKVMIVYGQANRVSDDELKCIDSFCKKINCVFAVDRLANLSCSKSVNVYNMASKKYEQTILDELKPDIVITMNGAIVSKLKGLINKKGIVHWEVAKGGKVSDPYNKITRVFECTPMQFISRVDEMISEKNISASYYELWKKNEILYSEEVNIFSQKYAVNNIVRKLPANCSLHLANSNTVRYSLENYIKDSINVYCNRGVNGIDGSASSYMGMVAVSKELCFLIIGDLSFFYDMNSLWNKELKGNIRIVLLNNNGAGLLKYTHSECIDYKHNTSAEGWVKSIGFEYLASRSKEEFDSNLPRFLSEENVPMFFEVFV